jgi:hypothetical protein
MRGGKLLVVRTYLLDVRTYLLDPPVEHPTAVQESTTSRQPHHYLPECGPEEDWWETLLSGVVPHL